MVSVAPAWADCPAWSVATKRRVYAPSARPARFQARSGAGDPGDAEDPAGRPLPEASVLQAAGCAPAPSCSCQLSGCSSTTLPVTATVPPTAPSTAPAAGG